MQLLWKKINKKTQHLTFPVFPDSLLAVGSLVTVQRQVVGLLENTRHAARELFKYLTLDNISSEDLAYVLQLIGLLY